MSAIVSLAKFRRHKIQVFHRLTAPISKPKPTLHTPRLLDSAPPDEDLSHLLNPVSRFSALEDLELRVAAECSFKDPKCQQGIMDMGVTENSEFTYKEFIALSRSLKLKDSASHSLIYLSRIGHVLKRREPQLPGLFQSAYHPCSE
jgi:hypothetical protein